MSCVASMRSMTQAMRAKYALVSDGINCEIVSLPPSLTRRGCAYGIRFECRFENSVRNRLQSLGMRSSEIVGFST